MIEIVENYNIDIAREIISAMFIDTRKQIADCTDPREKEKLEDRACLLQWELDMLTGPNKMLRVSLVDKALSQYAPIIKERDA